MTRFKLKIITQEKRRVRGGERSVFLRYKALSKISKKKMFKVVTRMVVLDRVMPIYLGNNTYIPLM